ncbi:MAG: hypothetical protein JAZ11_02890 [Candidatus Thiodiazotropha lotti]|nr:hypothetical protein [Candidatus Thiodiazotropha lotti]
MKLKYFSSITEAVTYMTTELLSTLRDDLARMERQEREHYMDEDRETMRWRIDDLESVADLVEQAFKEIPPKPKPPTAKRPEGELGYIVEYELPYSHRVQVGVYADSAEIAGQKVEMAFNEGTIWDDTPEMPLLYDDFEETGDAGVALKFNVVEQCKEFPEPDGCVTAIRRDDAGRNALAALKKRDLAAALQIVDSFPE